MKILKFLVIEDDALLREALCGALREALRELGSVDIHAMARKAAERWMKAQKLVSVLS